VAGVAALVLSANPRLRWDEVRDILARSARTIDRSGGEYRGGRSPFYGHGRVDARRAVELARAAEGASRPRRRRRRA
jgi:subtilisin family serine protease